jgi:hypothetical protein
VSIRVGRHGLHATDIALTALASEFSRSHVVRLPGFLDRPLLDLIKSRLSVAPFVPRVDEHGVELEQTLDDEPLAGLFTVALNDPRLFALIQSVTGCPSIGCFTGRVYRRAVRNDAGHYYPWHDDVSHDRLIGLSINLSDAEYGGGVLQIRDAATKSMVAEVANTGQGDGVLFRISSELEHQVTPLQGSEPRTVLAGWFRARPSYRDLLAEMCRKPS